MSERRRRLKLAVGDRETERLLADLLRRQDVDVELVPSGELEGTDADALVVQADAVDDELLEQDEGGPGVVVLASEQDDAQDARLMAAGVSAILDAEEQSDRELREQLMEVARAEADGGIDGPEAGGQQAQPKLVDFQSKSPRMREFVDLVRRVASSDSTLLVTGETGVGKERLARAIHAESPRAQGPFVAVNCGALPENLLESELFGHERGAFTGADQARTGRFEAAAGGTIFLDEIGEMSPHLQVHLLTVLQRREVRRLGAKEPRPIDVRVISATNRDLSDDVSEGRFREDLLFRLNVVALEIPPLRERTEDVPALVGRFLHHFAEVHDRSDLVGFDERALEALKRYAWPGNVREVVNVVERAVLLAGGPTIGLDDLPASLRPGASAGAPSTGGGDELLDLPLTEAKRRLVDEFERRYLDRLLRETGGSVGDTARRARINPRTLYEKMRRHDLDKSDY